MGIPSYYKKLADRIKGLITKSKPSAIEALYLDFNCLIYHCARRPNSTLPPFPTEFDEIPIWESLLLTDIVKYIAFLWHEVGQPEEVFIAVDGVVPFAKVKQQRLRRFKSVWLAQKEKEAGIRPNIPSWDTNCITPGTDFMKRLGQRLSELCAKHKGWTVSTDLEPGEGEHKIMNRLRARAPSTNPIVVYGMDADLIVLTMLNSQSPTFLLREDSEMGVVQVNGRNEETFSYFSIDVLKKTLWPAQGASVPYETVLEYVAAMSLLGNDFLPHSLTVKIKDDGHSFLIKELAALYESNQRLLSREDGLITVNWNSLHWLLSRWAKEEDSRFLHTVKRKLQMRGRVEDILENYPVHQAIEQPLVSVSKGEWTLKPVWKDTYRKEWLQCPTQDDIHRCCQEYLQGFQWIVDYYTGQRPVNLFWFYPRLVPPLWEDLVAELEHYSVPPIPVSAELPLQPQEQLALVLPMESWHFLGKSVLRDTLAKYPQFWPKSFGFFTAGRTRMWECEPLLPLIPVSYLRRKVDA
jgi:5'-3' exonuclease